MFLRLPACIVIAAVCLCGDWKPRLAADYLDSRQKQWFEWKNATAHGGPCVSCHTGTTYLLARPALRRALGETQATTYETGLLDALKARLDRPDPFPSYKREPQISQALGVESIHSALFLAIEDRGQMSPATVKAFDRMWSLQIREGESKGSWAWFSFKLDPWEMPQSSFYGATLAALAVGHTPASYRAKPEVQERIAALADYLQREQASQPLHNRVILLWASSRLPSVMGKPLRNAVIDELWQKQHEDGGWAVEALGPWAEHAAAAPSSGSNSYATALIAFALKEASVSSPKLTKAREWLKTHQNNDGYWAAESMNKRYQPDSMPALFMRDAATAFAVLALVE